MHSSRMRTIRCSGHLGGCLSGVVCPGRCLPRGVSEQGGVCPGGVCLGGVCLGVSEQGGLPGGVSAKGVSMQGVSV